MNQALYAHMNNKRKKKKEKKKKQHMHKQYSERSNRLVLGKVGKDRTYIYVETAKADCIFILSTLLPFPLQNEQEDKVQM
jgi:hypothetical protein